MTLKAYITCLVYVGHYTNQHIINLTPFLVSWIPCIRFYAFMHSTGETKLFSLSALLIRVIRYLILNFGNVANLNFNMW
jgi:hypothetical protein